MINLPKKLSVIIPCYNEEKTVGEIVNRVLNVNISPWGKEIIIIDDASTDNTSKIIRSLLIKNNIIKSFTLRSNSGKGTAIKTGVELATGNLILIQDADLEYNPKDIPLMLSKANNQVIVFGSRNIRKSSQNRGKVTARAGVWFLTKLVNILYKLSLTDIWTCYKLFPRSATRFLDPGRFESEILFTIKLAEQGFAFIEVPISYDPRSKREGKKIMIKDGIKAILLVLIYYIKSKLKIKNGH